MKSISHTLKLSLSFIFILLLSSSSCEKDALNGIKKGDLNSAIELSVNEKVLVNNEFVIELTSIVDSRCPADVQCVWAGNASTQFKISATNQTDLVTSLCIGQCDAKFKTTDSAEFTRNNIRYSILLKEVNPYPKEGASGDKKAVFEIRKI
jgi:hypothetical protein